MADREMYQFHCEDHSALPRHHFFVVSVDGPAALASYADGDTTTFSNMRRCTRFAEHLDTIREASRFFPEDREKIARGSLSESTRRRIKEAVRHSICQLRCYCPWTGG